jgi:hypothetical protein
MANKAADSFDLRALALTSKTLAELAPTQKQPQSKTVKRLHYARPKAFVKLPYERTLAMAG